MLALIASASRSQNRRGPIRDAPAKRLGRSGEARTIPAALFRRLPPPPGDFPSATGLLREDSSPTGKYYRSRRVLRPVGPAVIAEELRHIKSRSLKHPGEIAGRVQADPLDILLPTLAKSYSLFDES